jgi:hypothetical protein
MALHRRVRVAAWGVLTALAVLGLSAASWAQQNAPFVKSLKLADAMRMGLLESRIVSGRIVINVIRPRNAPFQNRGADQTELLILRGTGNQSLAKYEKSVPDEQMVIEVTNGTQLHATRTPQGSSNAAPVEFHQPATGTVSLIIGGKSDRRVYEGASLWHLLVSYREPCGQYLAPLLKMINAEWDLMPIAEDVERALLDSAGAQPPPDRPRWAALVRQLGSERFSERQAADRELRGVGRVLASYLQHLDRDQLDAEQWFRIQRIVQSLSPHETEDTAEETAEWLSGDPAVWLAMLSRDQESTRRLAAEQLHKLLGEPVAFDPAADAATRRTQIERLRVRIQAKR